METTSLPDGLKRDAAADEDLVRVRGRAGTLTFTACLDRHSRAEVFDLRQVVWRGSRDYLFGNRARMHPAEDEYDGNSLLFACHLEGQIVAACRWSPRGAGGFEAERLCALPRARLPAEHNLLQISRVVVREDQRRRQVSELLLLLSCRHLLSRTLYTDWFALCAPRLAEHYVHFGAEAVEGFEVALPERAGNVYRLVHGGVQRSIDRIGASLAALGEACPWSLPELASVATAVAR
jgi:hypothetical protein